MSAKQIPPERRTAVFRDRPDATLPVEFQRKKSTRWPGYAVMMIGLLMAQYGLFLMTNNIIIGGEILRSPPAVAGDVSSIRLTYTTTALFSNIIMHVGIFTFFVGFVIDRALNRR